jgi:putative ABC transport system ATP-binding protein
VTADFVELKNVNKVYKMGNTTVRALDGLSFSVAEGEFAVIVGASGAGKTTVLNLLGGMDTATGGEIIVDGKNIAAFGARKLDQYRRHDVGFVFQFYNLMPNLTAKENIEIAVEICKNAYKPAEVLAQVGLQERAVNFPSQLSGGEQQRVSIARAVAKNPKILLCDEPTGALDYVTGKLVLKLLHDICKTQKKTVIVVTHNTALTEIADRVINIKNGRTSSITQTDNPKSIEEVEW